MLCRVALHDELAELRAEVGPQVFDDPVAFRAAFDDFVPEGSASTGEVSLLVGAIATGALQRVKEQLALGADPEMTIAVQGDLLARDRGTAESSGARWALSALAHAIGVVPVERVLTRPTPGPDSVDTAGRPPAPARPTPTPHPADPGPTQQISDATRVASQETPDEGAGPTAPTGQPPPKRGTNPLLIAIVVVLAIVAIAAVAVLVLRDGDDPSDTAEDGSSASDDGGAQGDAEEVLAQADLSEGGQTMRVELVQNSTDTFLVLRVERDGELTEVDREPTSCPFLESSYEPGITSTGLELFWGWQNLDQAGFGEYGKIVPEIESLEIYGVGDDYVCPTD